MTTIDKLNDHEHVSADDIRATAEWLEGESVDISEGPVIDQANECDTMVEQSEQHD